MKRFEKVYSEGNAFTTMFTIFVDRETGVNYIFTKDGYGAGLTPLLDKDGKVVVTPVNK